MKTIEIAVIVLISILLVGIICYIIFKKSKNKNYNTEKLYGGDGLSVSNYGKVSMKRNLSCSEQVLSQTKHRSWNSYVSYEIRYLKYFTGQCLMKFKDNATMSYSDGLYLVSAHVKPKFISDSLLDGINLYLLNDKINQIFTKNEMRSDVMLDSSVKINDTPSSPYLLSSKDDLKINIQCMENNINNIIEIYKNLQPVPDIYVYLEFCYGDFKYSKFPLLCLYNEIHDLTLNILNQITGENIHPQRVYVLRYVINDNSETLNYNNVKFKNKNISYITINYYDEDVDNKFDTINIPSTKEYFKMDEFLLINTDKFNFHIQIEHSENMEKHKSNLVEFILRIGKIFGLSNEELVEFIRLFGYEFINGKFNCYLMENMKSIPKRSVFNVVNESFIKEYF